MDRVEIERHKQFLIGLLDLVGGKLQIFFTSNDDNKIDASKDLAQGVVMAQEYLYGEPEFHAFISNLDLDRKDSKSFNYPWWNYLERDSEIILKELDLI